MTRTLIVLGPAALGAAIARSLADGSVIVTADDFGRVRERYAEPVKAEARDYDYEDRRERQRQGVELAKRDGRYTGRKSDHVMHERILSLRDAGHTIAETARLAKCSASQVKRITALARSEASIAAQ